MADELKKAEQTAAEAAAAMVRVLDFGITVVNELAKTIVSLSTLRKTRAEPVRYSMRDPYVIHRYTQGKGEGEALLHRYLFSYFVVPFDVLTAAGGGRIIPFVLASLVSDERRPPSLVYGMLRNAAGRERNEESFLEHYLLWLNEGLARIKKSEAKQDGALWRVDGKELPARADSQILSADVSFAEMRLLDFTADNLPDRAEQIGRWYRDELRRAGTLAEQGQRPAGPSSQPVTPTKRGPRARG
jgi:hypothetical protein